MQLRCCKIRGSSSRPSEGDGYELRNRINELALEVVLEINAPLRFTEAVISGFSVRYGAGFKFDRPFKQWIKDGTPKTMDAVAYEWRWRQGDAP